MVQPHDESPHVCRLPDVCFGRYDTDLIEGERIRHGTLMECDCGRPVLIGPGTWIASRATLLSRVTIPDGTVVGTNAVAIRNVHPYAFAISNPGRILRYRFRHDHIQALLRIQWRLWGHAKVVAHPASR